MAANTRTPKKVISRLGLALFTMMSSWIVVLTIITTVVTVVAPQLMEKGWFVWALNDATLYGVGLPLFLLILHFVPDGVKKEPSQRKPFGVAKYLLVLVFCIGSLYLFSFVSQFIIGYIENFRDQPIIDNLEELSDVAPLVNLFFAVLVPAVGEEFIFRYMILKKMRGSGDKTYILFSALCFALFHINIGQFFYAFVVGAALAWLYVRTGKLWLPMLTHFIVNFIGVIGGPAIYSYNEDIYLVFMFGSILLAIVIFIAFNKRLRQSLAPSNEAGWPEHERASYEWQLNELYDSHYPAPPFNEDTASVRQSTPYGAAQQNTPLNGTSVPKQPTLHAKSEHPVPGPPQNGPHIFYLKRPATAAGVLFGNVGMVLYLLLSGVLIASNLLL